MKWGIRMDKSIATFDAITTIAQQEKVSITDDTLKIGSACFDAGAREILRHIAIVDIEKLGPLSIASNHTKRMSVECQEKYDLINTTINKIERPLLKEYDEAFHNLMAAEAHDYYIEGFIRGYAFLKYHITHRVGEFE
jgi:hypothetical protein